MSKDFSFNKRCCTFPNNEKIECSQGITESSSLINFSSMVLTFLPYTYGVLCDVIVCLLCQDIDMAFSPPVVGCLVKKGLQKGGSRAPQDPLATPLKCHSTSFVTP